MSYRLEVSERLDKLFSKIAKRDKLQFEILSRKIKEILENPKIGEPLIANMAGMRSVHVRHFVIIYEILEPLKIVRILDYNHHDIVYGSGH